MNHDSSTLAKGLSLYIMGCMKYASIAIMVAALTFGQGVRAESPDERYVQIYNLIQQADEYSRNGQSRSAYERYQQAKSALDTLQIFAPDWNAGLVKFRADYVAGKLSQFGSLSAPATTTAPADATTAPAGKTEPKVEVEKAAVATTPSVAAPKSAAPAADLKSLLEENQRLNADKATLEAKLKEALSAQPTTVNVQDMAKAEAKIKELQKENDLLKAAAKQKQEKASKTAKTADLDGVKKELSTAQKKIEEQGKLIENLQNEKTVLEGRLKTSGSAVSANTTVAPVAVPVVLPAAVPSPAPAVAAAASGDSKQVQQLESERDELRVKLKEALASKSSRRSKKDSEALLESLQARLAAYEARRTPMTEEELAYFEKREAVKTVTPKKPDWTPASNALVADAQRSFSEGKLDDAESKFQQVVKANSKSVVALGNLAAIQLEKGDLAKAEETLQQALALDPNDAHNLALVGLIKFREQKYDEAFEKLSLSAKLDPNDPKTQNYLGLTLSNKGQVEAAEKALRTAVKLDDRYAQAHYNLAVVYAMEKPPTMSMARLHYKKALDNGYQRNAEFEKLIEAKK